MLTKIKWFMFKTNSLAFFSKTFVCSMRQAEGRQTVIPSFQMERRLTVLFSKQYRLQLKYTKIKGM